MPKSPPFPDPVIKLYFSSIANASEATIQEQDDPGKKSLAMKVEDAETINYAANNDHDEYEPDDEVEEDDQDCFSDAEFELSDDENLEKTPKSASEEQRRLRRNAYKRANRQKRLKKMQGEFQEHITIYSQGGVNSRRRKALTNAKESGQFAQILEKVSKDISLTEDESKLLEDDKKVREHNDAKEAVCKEATESGQYKRLKEKKTKNEELTEDEERIFALCRMFDRRKVEKAQREGKLKLISWKKYKGHDLDEEDKEILALCEEFKVKLPTNHFRVSFKKVLVLWLVKDISLKICSLSISVKYCQSFRSPLIGLIQDLGLDCQFW